MGHPMSTAEPSAQNIAPGQTASLRDRVQYALRSELTGRIHSFLRARHRSLKYHRRSVERLPSIALAAKTEPDYAKICYALNVNDLVELKASNVIETIAETHVLIVQGTLLMEERVRQVERASREKGSGAGWWAPQEDIQQLLKQQKAHEEDLREERKEDPDQLEVHPMTEGSELGEDWEII